MGSIFTNQTYLRIRLTAGVNITGSTKREIHYTKPDGTTSGILTATVEDMVQGIIYYDLPPASTLLDVAGNWKFHAYIEFADGRVARGETWKEKIYLDTV
jgi:hypothetical protein